MRSTWKDGQGEWVRSGACEDRFPVMGNDTNKDPVMGKFSKKVRLASKVQQKQQQKGKSGANGSAPDT